MKSILLISVKMINFVHLNLYYKYEYILFNYENIFNLDN
jgi:hypothetical protein